MAAQATIKVFGHTDFDLILKVYHVQNDDTTHPTFTLTAQDDR